MTATTAPETAPRPHILVVDDEEATRLLLARILTAALEVEITLAGTCEQALRLAGSNAYAAVLLDLMMPGIGGFGVLKQLRANSPNAATPIIIVSVLSEPDTIERCMAAGASTYLLKPIERNTLIAALTARIAVRVKARQAL